MSWNEDLQTRFVFFTGKGGVGKTSLASATALGLAEAGHRTLILSTDPASNLDEVFGLQLGIEPTEIPNCPNLFAANLDPEATAAAYREAMVGPFRGSLPEAVLRSMEEQLSGACTTEIAAFQEFVRYLAQADSEQPFEHIVFDTAPTGHTLRLLSLPTAWSGYLNTTTAETSCLGPLAGLKEQRARFELALTRLADPALTTAVLVARPERGSLAEAARTCRELAELNIQNVRLLVNAVYASGPTNDPLALAFANQIQQSLSEMPEALKPVPTAHILLLPGNVVGIEALRRLLRPDLADIPNLEMPAVQTGLDIQAFIQDFSRLGHGVIMTMGKGGVGKTTVAVQIAQALAAQGHTVRLTTTDPAGNLTDLVGAYPSNLSVSKIDAAEEVKKYTASVMAKAAANLDAAGLDLLREDLRSPCTEEIAVFWAFADAVAEGERGFVVIDTAPTGHTILLMDATEAYHREVSRTQSDAPESVRKLLPRLRDPDYTHVVLVTLPEPTPVHEAMKLRADLGRAGVNPYGWVINRSLAAAGVSEPRLRAKAAQEAASISEVMETRQPVCVLPWKLGDRP